MDDSIKKMFFGWYEALAKCMRERDQAYAAVKSACNYTKEAQRQRKDSQYDAKVLSAQLEEVKPVVAAACTLHDAVLAFEAFNDATPNVNVSVEMQDRCAELDRAIIYAQYSIVAAVRRLPDPISGEGGR
jgi:hypothetical protein